MEDVSAARAGLARACALIVGEDAVLASPALRIYVCNVATQDGETADLDLAGHVEALAAHAGAGIVDVVLANNRPGDRATLRAPSQPVRLTWPPAMTPAPKVVLDDVVDATAAQRHDPDRLAAAVIRILEREGAARRRASASRTA